jgi:transposase
MRQNGTIKAAAEKFDINFSTAKAILHTYRKEGRVGRKIRRHNKNSCFLKIKKRSPKFMENDGNSSEAK